MPRATPSLDSADVPQAPNLARIRAVLTAVAGGTTARAEIAEATDIATRHVGYALRAAQALGLLDEAFAPTPRGRALLDTEQESDAERTAFRESIEASPVVKVLAPGLLSAKPPTRKALAARIEKVSGLAPATADHRANDLLAWREQLLDEG